MELSPDAELPWVFISSQVNSSLYPYPYHRTPAACADEWKSLATQTENLLQQHAANLQPDEASLTSSGTLKYLVKSLRQDVFVDWQLAVLASVSDEDVTQDEVEDCEVISEVVDVSVDQDSDGSLTSIIKQCSVGTVGPTAMELSVVFIRVLLGALLHSIISQDLSPTSKSAPVTPLVATQSNGHLVWAPSKPTTTASLPNFELGQTIFLPSLGVMKRFARVLLVKETSKLAAESNMASSDMTVAIDQTIGSLLQQGATAVDCRGQQVTRPAPQLRIMPHVSQARRVSHSKLRNRALVLAVKPFTYGEAQAKRNCQTTQGIWHVTQLADSAHLFLRVLADPELGVHVATLGSHTLRCGHMDMFPPGQSLQMYRAEPGRQDMRTAVWSYFQHLNQQSVISHALSETPYADLDNLPVRLLSAHYSASRNDSS